MPTQKKSIPLKLMSTEPEWNPKLMLGRVVVRVLPNRAFNRLKKICYGYLNLTSAHVNALKEKRSAEVLAKL